jgi:hypothetical protein
MSTGAELAAGSFPDPEGTHRGYGEAFFERMLGQAFAVACREVRPSGARMLYHVRPW